MKFVVVDRFGHLCGDDPTPIRMQRMFVYTVRVGRVGAVILLPAKLPSVVLSHGTMKSTARKGTEVTGGKTSWLTGVHCA